MIPKLGTRIGIETGHSRTTLYHALFRLFLVFFLFGSVDGTGVTGELILEEILLELWRETIEGRPTLSWLLPSVAEAPEG